MSKELKTCSRCKSQGTWASGKICSPCQYSYRLETKRKKSTLEFYQMAMKVKVDELKSAIDALPDGTEQSDSLIQIAIDLKALWEIG